MKEQNIIHWEIDFYGDKPDYHVQEVGLIGFDESGNKYEADAIVCCGELEEITNIIKL